MGEKPVDFPNRSRTELRGLIDAALPECFWKNRFNKQWADLGLQSALDNWLREAPIVNHHFVPLIRAKVEEMLQCQSSS